jgi:putative membrane protein insertion efficiency factor
MLTMIEGDKTTNSNVQRWNHRFAFALIAGWRFARYAPVLLATLAIRCYQIVIRPHLIGCCRFYPTCSDYTIEALRTHGLVRGSVLAAHRLARCHPFSNGGIDQVPR